VYDYVDNEDEEQVLSVRPAGEGVGFRSAVGNSSLSNPKPEGESGLSQRGDTGEMDSGYSAVF